MSLASLNLKPFLPTELYSAKLATRLFFMDCARCVIFDDAIKRILTSKAGCLVFSSIASTTDCSAPDIDLSSDEEEPLLSSGGVTGAFNSCPAHQPAVAVLLFFLSLPLRFLSALANAFFRHDPWAGLLFPVLIMHLITTELGRA